MSEETNERYYLEVTREWVLLIDGADLSEAVMTFTGPDRLLAATAELNRLNYEAEHVPEFYRVGPDTDATAEPNRLNATEEIQAPSAPSAFLAETLPALARQQRLEGQLIQAGEIFDQAVNEVAKWSKILNDATGTIGRIEEALARPLSEPLAAQKGSEVGQDTLIAQGLLKAFEPIERALFKPQPY